MEDQKNKNQTDGTVTGVFNDKEDAEKAYSDLLKRGYKSEDITVLMSDETRKTHFKGEEENSDLGSKAMEKAGVGSAIGGTAGAIIGAIAAIGTTVAIPGLGLLIAGPLAAGLAGAGAGGLTGGLIGALVGSGIPKERAEVYKSKIKEGAIVLGVTPKDKNESSEIARNWKTNYRGEEIHGVGLGENFYDSDTSSAHSENRSQLREENQAQSGNIRSGADSTSDFDDDFETSRQSGREKTGVYQSDDMTHSTDELKRDSGSFSSENQLDVKGNWNEVKGKLKQKYASLTDDDLTYREGREDEMLGKLQQKTGKNKAELTREINSYSH